MSNALIVEDDVATRHLFEALVHRNQFQATSAGDGQTALHCLETSDFDVILLDLFLPGIDGWEVLRRVSLATPHLLTRFIVVTAASETEYENSEGIALVWCVIRKPFEVRALEDQLLRCRAAKVAASPPASANA